MSQPLQEVTVAPDFDPDTAWWWEALEAGELRIPHCRACERHFFPPIPACAHCGSTDIDSSVSTGEGRVYSWIVAHHPLDETFKGHTPYTVVAVELEAEGVRLFGRIENGPLDEDTRARAYVYKVSGSTLLGFERTDSRAPRSS
ncbi:zinc ribbon domain-containing protein [Streptomyces sp. NPDC051219]|uniref:Zn-ribbon domain-containing OB-fold protein n=1 Tax=Streptomyces sp. NPDC051219 TaxID=3155283 RepID=UPI003447AF2E